MAAAARPARAHAQPADADAAAGLERRRLYQLSRQCGDRNFVDQAAKKAGVDVFRVFDSLNWVENMRVAIDAVLESGKICEARSAIPAISSIRTGRNTISNTM